MTPKQRDIMAVSGVICIAVAAFMVGVVVGFLAVGSMLLAAVYLLTPSTPERTGQEEDFDGR